MTGRSCPCKEVHRKAEIKESETKNRCVRFIGVWFLERWFEINTSSCNYHQNDAKFLPHAKPRFYKSWNSKKHSKMESNGSRTLFLNLRCRRCTPNDFPSKADYRRRSSASAVEQHSKTTERSVIQCFRRTTQKKAALRERGRPRKIRHLAFYFTSTGGKFQISEAYSLIVRSDENLPTRAVFMIAIRAHFDLSLNASLT